MRALVRQCLSFLGFSGHKTAGALPFELLLRYFREVLDSKNRALEVLAGMGETLGGEYLFDINYIKKTYAELYASVKKSLDLFDTLTQCRYSKIREVSRRIDRQVGAIIDDPAHEEEALVYSHGDITWDMSAAVGGKNADLAELRNYANVRIPDGFAVTAHAFDEFMRHNRLEEKVRSIGNNALSEQSARELRDAVINAEIPAPLSLAIENVLAKIRAGKGDRIFLAVRSSASEEDGVFSFAGQFETVLNVLPELVSVQEAYKRVIASLFSLKAFEYHRKTGIDICGTKMAVCCLAMVDAAVSGVVYSTDPAGTNAIIINAAWGLGSAIVEGRIEADYYAVAKGLVPRILETKIGNKTRMVVAGSKGGVLMTGVPAVLTRTPSLTDGQIRALSLQAMQIEKYYKHPCDIEWAIDRGGSIFILQARPLRVASRQDNPAPAAGNAGPGVDDLASFQPLMKDKGVVVQKGIASGRVFVLRHMDDLAGFPKGGILVARNDSSDFIRALTHASAVITDTGTPTSHMASLCREFRVPTLVNTGDASKFLKHGQELTLNFDDDGRSEVYEGVVRELLDRAQKDLPGMDDVYEFRKKRHLLRYITPLNLVDPLMDNFAPEGCRTLHDILRFIHEKSVAELVDKARYGSDMLRKHAAIKLELPVPAGIIVVDIGGGLRGGGERSGEASIEQIASEPLLAIIQGMTFPGIWRSDAVALRAGDFFSSMMRMPDITSGPGDYVGFNIAIASKEYVNLSLRFGYHLSMIDSYCSDNIKNNHIYFRFSGGATDIAKRSRRIQLIANILKEFGFNIIARGDLIIGRLGSIPHDEMVLVLDRLGRLISYTRQLDALLHDDEKIAGYTRRFMEENYEI